MVMLGKLSLFVNFGLHKVGHTIGCICPCCFVVISLVTCERRHIKQGKNPDAHPPSFSYAVFNSVV